MPNDAKRADDERWARAQAVLDTADDEGARIQQRRIKRRVIGLLAGLGVLLVLAIVLILLFAHPDTSADDQNTSSTGQELLGLVFIVAGLVFIVAGLVKGMGRGQRNSRWSAPTAMLTRAQRKDLTRQVRGKAPVDEQHLPLSRDLAERIVRARWLVFMLAGLALLQAGGAIQDPARWRLAYLAVVAILCVFGTVSTLRSASQAQRFLAAHPA